VHCPAADLKGRVELKPGNILNKAYVHWKRRMAPDRQNGTRFRDALLSMVRTGHYYPGGAFLEPRNLLIEPQVDSIWAIMTSGAPQGVTLQHVMDAFFKCHDRIA
jgi:hypothetical protein